MDRRRFLRATFIAFGAQGITAFVSAATVLLLAGRLDAESYGLWQLYLLVSSYTGLTHLGLCDGICLHNGGIDYGDLDAPRLGTLFRRMCAVQLLLSLFASGLIILLFPGHGGRMWAVMTAFIYMPVFNMGAFLGYIHQATGNTAVFSASTMIDRVSFVVMAAFAAASGRNDFRFYILLNIAAKFISFVYLVIRTKRIVFAPAAKDGVALMAKRFVASGSKLVISNLSGQFVTGAARTAVIFRYGDAEFGRISFIMTVAGVILQSASQVSMVLFPSLRREDKADCELILKKLDSAAAFLFPASFLLYLPVKYAVQTFFPEYADGIKYLALLMPLCLFDGKTQLTGVTYFKVCGKERSLMFLNVFSALLSAVFCMSAALVGLGTDAIIASAVVASAVRSICADIIRNKESASHDKNISLKTISELLICALFYAATLIFSDVIAVIMYSMIYLIYVYLRRNEFEKILPSVKCRRGA